MDLNTEEKLRILKNLLNEITEDPSIDLGIGYQSESILQSLLCTDMNLLPVKTFGHDENYW